MKGALTSDNLWSMYHFSGLTPPLPDAREVYRPSGCLTKGHKDRKWNQAKNGDINRGRNEKVFGFTFL